MSSGTIAERAGPAGEPWPQGQARLAEGDLTVVGTPVRVLAGADLIAVHTASATAAGAFAGFDIFRLDGDDPAEHWRAVQQLPLYSTNGHSPVDGPCLISQPGQSATSRKVIDLFVGRVLIGGDHAQLCRFVTTGVIQHDPDIADGVSAMWLAVCDPRRSYQTHHMTVADGEFALTACTGTIDGEATAFYDLYRLEHAMIAEHWGVVTAAPEHMPYSVTAPIHQTGQG